VDVEAEIRYIKGSLERVTNDLYHGNGKEPLITQIGLIKRDVRLLMGIASAIGVVLAGHIIAIWFRG
jgi:hypothetical protein